MGEIIKLTEENHPDIYALSQFAFQYDLSSEELEKKKLEAETHQIWGWTEGKNLAAKLHVIPLQCYINGQVFDMGGINAVATWPEYRRKGIVKKLLLHALQEMKKQGQSVSFLHPFSFAFYRKYGWEHTFTNKNYSIPMNLIKEVSWNAEGYVKRKENDYSLLQAIYKKYAGQFNGTLIRDDHWWEYRVNTDKKQIAVSYNKEDKANGYLIYQVKNDKLTVEEMVYHSVKAQKTLFQFLANHDSMADTVELTVPENDQLTLLMDNPSFKQEIKPYFMARIVDVETFLRNYTFEYPAEFAPFTITIEDHFFTENEGSYLFGLGNENISISKQSKRERDVNCSIQHLTMMMLGFKRPKELLEAELISGDEEAIVTLEKIIPVSQTFLPDFF